MHNFDPKAFIIEIVVIILSITLHEFGHAISADRLGDDTPRRQGRITLWPDKHFDMFGLIMIFLTTLLGFGLGWGKPVEVNTRNFRHPRRDMRIVAICGPLMNLLLAIIAGLILRFVISAGSPDWMYTTITGQFVFAFLLINLSLMFFNLIPIHPLDGGKILSSLLPFDQSVRFDRFMWQWGPIILLITCFTGVGILGALISPAVFSTMRLLIGPSFG